MTGGWNVNVSVGMPQKVATAMAKLSENLLGAEYTPIFYLGSQVVNGTNHAVLVEQLVTTGKDMKNIVILVFNEKPGDIDLSLVGIDRILESGGALGGTSIDIVMEIAGGAAEAWNDAFEGFVGTNVTPLALLGTQVVNGTNYIYVAEVEAISTSSEKKIALVTINDKLKKVSFINILTNRQETSLGYSFTW